MRKLSCRVETWPLKSPFSITGHIVEQIELLYVEIEERGKVGKGEGSGVYYLGETGQSMLAQAESARGMLEEGVSREILRRSMPAGGARNALDCALWDLHCKFSDTCVWSALGASPEVVATVNTVGIDTPSRMADQAVAFDNCNLKIKLDGSDPLTRVQAIRNARPEANIVIDVNQGWTFSQLVSLAPKLAALGVKMIEQPLPRGRDGELEYYDSPIPLCADESCLNTAELDLAVRRYEMINIKLDKTGGLTEALELVSRAREQGMQLMVGNMIGTSLGMAPAYVIAQSCKYVDIDGPTFLLNDRPHGLQFHKGKVSIPSTMLWG